MPKGSVTAAQSGEVVKMSPLKRFVEVLSMEAETESRESNAVFIEALMTEMLEADGFDAAIAAGEKSAVLSGKDLAEKQTMVRLRAFSFVKSDDEYASQLGHYVRFDDAIDISTGEPIVAATGAANVVIPLWKARNGDELPIDVQFYLDGRVVKIRRVPKLPVEGTVGF
jgi:hypothetical protein